jgi:DNA-binding MarR family transcriptional regulator
MYAQTLQDHMVALVRAFGLHRPDQTPCGQPVGVSAAHALMELSQDAPLSQGDLARRLRLEKSTVSRLVKQLEQRGWVQQARDSLDGRVVLLKLTEQGCQAADQLAAARAAKFARIAASLPAREQESVLHVLRVLVQAMSDNGEKENST